jgi:hypothetical protein
MKKKASAPKVDVGQVDDLIFDVSGLLYRTYFAAKAVPFKRKSSLFTEEEEGNDKGDLPSFALHTALISMSKFFKQFKPGRVVACFDRPNNWRKQYMTSDLSVSQRGYKAQRRVGMTATQKKEYYELLDHMAEFERLLESETGIITLACDGLEADDCIAGWAQRHPERNKVIMTTDSDMSQLINPTTNVCNYKTGEIVVIEDPKFFLFEKAFRGDKADNIVSAYPGIRTTKLKQIYQDSYALANVLKEKVAVPDVMDVEVLVEDIFNENMLLMDLSAQPPAIRKKIDRTIDEELAKTKRFDYWKFSAFCTERKMQAVLNSLQALRPMLVGGYDNVR